MTTFLTGKIFISDNHSTKRGRQLCWNIFHSLLLTFSRVAHMPSVCSIWPVSFHNKKSICGQQVSVFFWCTGSPSPFNYMMTTGLWSVSFWYCVCTFYLFILIPPSLSASVWMWLSAVIWSKQSVRSFSDIVCVLFICLF